MNIAPNDKRQHYKTAIATTSCSLFKAGECVAVKYSGANFEGVHFYDIDRSEKGKLPHRVAYPEHHLTSFAL